MSDIKPEDLKRLAEYMGKTFQENRGGNIYIKHGGFQHGFPYRPDEDNNQMVEIMEKLLIGGTYELSAFPFSEMTYSLVHLQTSRCFVGKSLNEAVTLAAIAAIS